MSEWLASSRTTNEIWLVAAGVVADQVGDVDAGDRGARDRPRCATRPSCRSRSSPVVGERLARGLGRASPVGARFARDQPRAVAAVVAQPQDVDVVVRGRRLDLEGDRLALVDAHRRREALDRRVAGAVDLPVARAAPGLRVLARDRVDDRRRAGRRLRHGRGHAEHHQRRDQGEQDRRRAGGRGLHQLPPSGAWLIPGPTAGPGAQLALSARGPRMKNGRSPHRVARELLRPRTVLVVESRPSW